jgi:hypothetical protein
LEAVRAPKPLFYVLVALTAVSMVAAIRVRAARPPAIALNEPLVLRVETGAVVFVIGYALVALLALGYDGAFTRRLGLPGGAAIDTQRETREGLDAAAGEFAEFRLSVEERLEAHDTAIDDLDNRLYALESDDAR